MARKVAEMQFKQRLEKQQQKDLLRRAKQLKGKWASFWEQRTSGFPTRSDTNQAVQPLKMARDLEFRIYKEEVLY